jgi:hypothetical protein
MTRIPGQIQYVHCFREPEGPEGRERADGIVRAYRQLLLPFEVDVRGIPGWLLGPEHEARMKRDAIDLRSF